jgi:hypothetical protein
MFAEKLLGEPIKVTFRVNVVLLVFFAFFGPKHAQYSTPLP